MYCLCILEGYGAVKCFYTSLKTERIMLLHCPPVSVIAVGFWGIICVTLLHVDDLRKHEGG